MPISHLNSKWFEFFSVSLAELQLPTSQFSARMPDSRAQLTKPLFIGTGRKFDRPLIGFCVPRVLFFLGRMFCTSICLCVCVILLFARTICGTNRRAIAPCSQINVRPDLAAWDMVQWTIGATRPKRGREQTGSIVRKGGFKVSAFGGQIFWSLFSVLVEILLQILFRSVLPIWNVWPSFDYSWQ